MHEENRTGGSRNQLESASVLYACAFFSLLTAQTTALYCRSSCYSFYGLCWIPPGLRSSKSITLLHSILSESKGRTFEA